jgi:ParB family chromosome partitioning protein
VVDSLREALGTKVTLQGTAQKGKITLEYYSREDLERIIEKIAPFNV